MDYLQWKTQMCSEYFSRNFLAEYINHWKNITADGLFRKNVDKVKSVKKYGSLPTEVSDMARNMEIELLTFSLILYQSKNCGHRIHVLFMMCHTYLLILWNEEKRMIMKILLNRNCHSNVNVLSRFYKHFLTSLCRSTLFDIFLKSDSKQKYLQVEQR
jgi:hypothetical protein